MAELNRDRVRAAKLRAQKKPLTAEQRQWLDAYDARTTKGRAQKQRAMPSGATTYTPTAPARAASSGAPVITAPLPPREQLTLVGDTIPSSVPVHETERLEDALDPNAYTWIPEVPPAAPDAEPHPPGAPQPPPPGSPILDAQTPSAAAAPQGDPAAAAQFAALVVFLTQVGIESGLELLAGAPVPPGIKLIAADEKTQAKVLEQVGAAAARVAMKYGFTSVPMADEAIVVGAIGGSALAFVTVQKRKMLAAAKVQPAQPTQQAEPKKAPEADLPSELSKLFEGQS